ncbi:MAG: GxxExxY protein [Abitibacteriaceae bacterium]|nr:GxxExxY protein [Abditibacteriaceae bacterium]MBV9864832.1 GxxExxY protein [Abditibacteriaceae bacterium]
MRNREEVARAVVQSFYAVYDTLGYGFLEKVYESALAMEVAQRGFQVERQAPIEVFYKGEVIGTYFTDLLIERCLIVEIKAVENLALEHEAQLLNYLKATEINLGLLVNFGPKPQVKRKIFETARKSI